MQKSCLGWIPGTALTFALSINVYAAPGDAYTWPGYRSDLVLTYGAYARGLNCCKCATHKGKRTQGDNRHF